MPKDGRTSLKHGSTRVARLARWLGEPRPKKSEYQTLRLEVKEDGEWSLMQQWDAANVSIQLAETIDDLIVEYANEQAVFLTARVVWYSDKLQAYNISYTMKVAPENDGQDGGQAFAGDTQSSNIQTQRHLEFMMRSHLGGIAAAMQALRETLGTTKEELLEALQELARVRVENHELRSQLMEVQQQLEEALSAAETAVAEKQETETQNNVIALITQQLQRTPPKAS